MMAIDASIYAQFAPRQRSAWDVMQDASSVDLARGRNALQQLALAQGQSELAANQRAQDRANALEQLRAGLGGQSDIDVLKAYRDRGYFTEAGTIEKGMLERELLSGKIDSEAAAANRERALATKGFGEAQADALKRYRGALDFIDSPQGAERWMRAQYADPLLSGHMQSLGSIDQALAGIPREPKAFAQWRNLSAMGMEKWLQQQLDATKAAETGRHNRATEAAAAGHLALARTREGREATAPRGQIVQSDHGTVLVDPRSGRSTVVTGPDGKPLGPKLRDIPANAQSAMVTNATNLRRAELALSLAEGKDVGQMKGDAAATGWKGYLPGALLQRVDANGVDARAAIADLGSLVIHDRSGAAVTAAEFPRLAPFIPQATDDADTVKKKLRRFVQVYREELGAMQATYSRDAGYRAPSDAPAGFRFLGAE